MYPWNFFCEEAEIKQHTFSKKEFCEIGEEAIFESGFTRFFLVFHFLIIMFYIMYFLLFWSSISMFNRIHNRNFNTTGQTGRIVPVTICYAMFTNTNRHNISYIHPDYSHEPFCSDESNSILRSPNHHYHQRYHHQRHHHHHHHHEIHGIIKS